MIMEIFSENLCQSHWFLSPYPMFIHRDFVREFCDRVNNSCVLGQECDVNFIDLYCQILNYILNLESVRRKIRHLSQLKFNNFLFIGSLKNSKLKFHTFCLIWFVATCTCIRFQVRNFFSAKRLQTDGKNQVEMIECVLHFLRLFVCLCVYTRIIHTGWRKLAL